MKNEISYPYFLELLLTLKAQIQWRHSNVFLANCKQNSPMFLGPVVEFFEVFNCSYYYLICYNK